MHGDEAVWEAYEVLRRATLREAAPKTTAKREQLRFAACSHHFQKLVVAETRLAARITRARKQRLTSGAPRSNEAQRCLLTARPDPERSSVRKTRQTKALRWAHPIESPPAVMETFEVDEAI